MARFTQPIGGGGGIGPTGPAGPQGEPGADGADALWNFIGEYDNGADYNVGDVVTYLGGTYYRILPPNPGYPPGTVYWTTIAEPGADGAQGVPGPQGEPGIAGTTAIVQHEVKAGVALTKGMAVYVTGSTGNDGTNMIVAKASNVSEAMSSKTMGLIMSTLAINDFGYVITEGLLTGLDTNSAEVGDPVWLGVDGALIYGLANKPSAPAHLVYIGVVTRKNQNNGEIFVKPQNGFELSELHTVALESNGSIADNEVLAYDTASGLWKNQTATEANLVTKGAFNYAQNLGTKISNVNATGTTLVSTSITTSGYPVHVIVTGDAEMLIAGSWVVLQLYRGTTPIGNIIQVQPSDVSENSSYALQIIDTPSAGTYTYSMKVQNIAVGSSFDFGQHNGPTMCIMELGK